MHADAVRCPALREKENGVSEKVGSGALDVEEAAMLRSSISPGAVPLRNARAIVS